MRKWSNLTLAAITVCFGAVLAPACTINIDEDGSDDWDEWGEEGDWDDEASLELRARTACEPYCLKLIECGALSNGSFAACTSLCESEYEANEDVVEEGCSCVAEATCGSSEIEECEGAPLDEVWDEGDSMLDDGAGGSTGDPDGGDAGTGGGDGTGGSVGEPDGATCATNHECAIGSDCVDGTCLGRCVASCQCAEGEACEAGYCMEPVEPEIECQTDCDCTSGMSCMEGFCVE